MPPGAKQKKPVTTSPSDAPQVSTPVAGEIPTPESEASGEMPMVEEEADWLQTESSDEVYQAMLMTLESDKMVEDVATFNILNPLSWPLVWIDAIQDVDNSKNKELMKRPTMVIWHQTMLAVGHVRTLRCTGSPRSPNT